MFCDGSHTGAFNLFVTVSATNFPDIMLPAYHENQWYFMFFLTFILLGTFFMMHVVFAVVLVTYRAHLKLDYLYRRTHQLRSLVWCARDATRRDATMTGAVLSVAALTTAHCSAAVPLPLSCRPECFVYWPAHSHT